MFFINFLLLRDFKAYGVSIMEYHALLDIATELAYRQAMAGAETYRVEESVSHIMASYHVDAEVFAIPNCLIVSMETPNGEQITRMKRIGYHGNDLDSVERYNSLIRKICAETPTPEVAVEWLRQADQSQIHYRLPGYLLGNALGACGFAVFFGGSFIDCICSGICGILVGIINRLMNKAKVNSFFGTIAASFLISLLAYTMKALGINISADNVIIGAMMILVPGLLFTNAMRDIIFGDTTSGVNRTVQVLLTAAAIALGTATAWRFSETLWGTPIATVPSLHGYVMQCLAAFIGCIGFFIVFNIHGPGGFLCALGGLLSWAAYCAFYHYNHDSVAATFFATILAAIYSEIMARVRKCPAISYLVVSIFPLLPGAGIYYTANYVVRSDYTDFAHQGLNTIALAGVIAVGILIVSTLVKLLTIFRKRKKC